MSRRAVALLAWGLVLVVAVASLAVLAWDNHADRVREDAVDGAVARGRSAVTDLLSYEPGRLSAELHSETRLMTPGFADRYESMINRSVLPTATRDKIRSAAAVKDVAVTSRGRDRVILLMFVNVVTSAADSPQPRAGGSRLRVTMVERNGSWVVGDVDAI